MDRKQRSVLITASLSHGLIHISELSVPPLLMLIQREFKVADFQMGQVVATYGLLFGLGALPAGLLVDRLGSKRLLVVCLWGASASMLAMALSPSFGWFTICAAGMGLSLSLYHPAGTSLIVASMHPTGKVFATHGMAGNLGVASSSVLAGGLGARLGWRWALGLLAVPALALGVRALTLPTGQSRQQVGDGAQGRWRRLVLLLLAAGFMGMVYRGMTTFLPKLFSITYTDNVQTGTALGGALTTTALLVGIAGMFLAGRVADSGRHPATVFLAGALAQLPLLAMMAYAGALALVPLAMSVAFFHFWTQPPGNQLVARYAPARARGLGYGLYFFMAFGAGSTGAGLSGWVSDNVGLIWIFPTLALLLVPSALAILTLRLRAGR
jgi:predicted MFS family arabinose efflux permease